jgi:hypothetical protein
VRTFFLLESQFTGLPLKSKGHLGYCFGKRVFTFLKNSLNALNDYNMPKMF